MSEAAAAHGHAEHHQGGFVSTYVFSMDHKMIGKQFLLLSLCMMIIGGILALMVRWQLAYPETPVPGMAWVPEPYLYDGIIPPETYNMLFTMHATIMVFFVIIPILVGAFGNFLIPLMIGTRDMAFPVLSMLSFWIAAFAGMILLSSVFVDGGAAAGGWTAYTPLSADPVFTGVGLGQDMWIVALVVLGISSLMGSINYITTIINLRAPGMTMFRLPLVIWSLFITATLLLLALPELTAAMAMLLFDRRFGTSFFKPEGGGEPILWQHLFWFFGHPEVYILILPGMGVASEILAVFSRKPIFGYRAMAMAMITIAFLGWVVWGHHTFQSGMNPTMGMAFMTTTMVIAVPSAIKTFNWLGTLWGGSITFKTPMLHALAFVSMFVIGGLSGIYMAATPVDIFIHDTYFIVGHIHYVVFGGSVFAIFAAISYWFPKMYGKMMNETLGKIHFFGTLIFFNITFFPMHIIGVGGHMRRIYNPTQYEFLLPLQHWNEVMTIGAIGLGLFQIVFAINFFWSMWAGEDAPQNPWNANTLEWEAPTPPPHGNFLEIPTVYRGPYEYSVPGEKEDWLPQARPGGAVAAAH